MGHIFQMLYEIFLQYINRLNAFENLSVESKTR